uniref:RRM domain-containing protein n=1 Tax=Psilocybe cubensis TaxID=181762 RepID=A0A8H8CJ26_PSICU
MSADTVDKKEVEEGSTNTVPHGSTLFVSNLPYNATSVDLQTLFSDIAPVRSAFVVTEHGTGVSKGVGYVSFALKEDAQAAFENITKEGISLVGRKLRVQWADSKPKEKGEKGERKEVVKKEPKPRPAHQQPRLPHDPFATRTIVISGLPPGLDSKVLWKKIRKYEGAEKVDWPIKDEEGNEDPTTAHVLYTSSSQAYEAVNKLHAHVYKGCLLSVTLKKRLDTLSKPTTTVAKGSESLPTSGKGKAVAAPSHASRLIVRNIPFNATEQDLRAIFLPYGPIYSIHIPLDDKGNKKDKDREPDVPESSTAAAYAAAKKPRTKGFAFVWMLSKKDAERAMEGCNGMVMRAGTAEALVSEKQKKKKLLRLEKKAAARAAGKEVKAENEGENEDEDMDKPKADDKRATERVIAVDWALSKEKWKEEKAKMDEDIEMRSASGSGSSDSGSSAESDEESDGGLGVHDGSESDSDDSESDVSRDESDEEEPVKPQLPAPEAGTTLFIRNIPFNATEDELRTLFRSFGPLRYARITMDHETGRSRGTGFACFWNIEDADRAVQQSELLRSETTGQAVAASIMPKKNPFSLPSILTPDPSSSLAQSLVLHGRTLDVVRAVTRDVAGKLKETNERAREKADKRNMYLIREGVIMPNTPASENLTPAEIERRTSSFNARRALLKSNPSLFISKTRLSVRQIPIFVTERMVKRLVTHSIKAFNAEVKQGTRAPLSADELADPLTEKPAEPKLPIKLNDESESEDENQDKKKKKKKGKFTGRDTGVKQIKIVRQAERIDPITGKGRSKGYGFVEMHRHSDALRFLRWANNNTNVNDLFDAWWKDELENMLKAERAKDADARDDARIKRLKEEIDRAEQHPGGKKGKGTLIVEFSIENIQVLQRRAAMQSTQKNPDAAIKGPSTDKKRKSEPEERHTQKSDERSPKKRRTGNEKTKPEPEKETKSIPSNPLGSIIGRKRKERKAGGKKGGK